MSLKTSELETETGQLYGDLWNPYDDDLFLASVDLFEKRWVANGESPGFFRGKRCLDVGCGGGRYSIAMARLGASSVVGVDISESGLSDARKRAERHGVKNVEFQTCSALEISLPDEEFDFVCCSGVLHHTPGVESGLREIFRLLKPGGRLYLLLYGAGGLFWPSNALLRPLAALLGKDKVDQAISSSGCPKNTRRSILDDLFVPVLETYTRERVAHLLQATGFRTWRYWEAGRLDHEADAGTMLEELNKRLRIWESGVIAEQEPRAAVLENLGAEVLRTVQTTARMLIQLHAAGAISDAELRDAVVGHGHHRLIAEK